MIIVYPEKKMGEFELFVMVCDSSIMEMRRNLSAKRHNTYYLRDVKPMEKDTAMNTHSENQYVWYDEFGWRLLTADPKEWSSSISFCRKATEVTRNKHFKKQTNE